MGNHFEDQLTLKNEKIEDKDYFALPYLKLVNNCLALQYVLRIAQIGGDLSDCGIHGKAPAKARRVTTVRKQPTVPRAIQIRTV